MKDEKNILVGIIQMLVYIFAVAIYVSIGILMGLFVILQKIAKKAGLPVFLATFLVGCAHKSAPVAYYKLYECEEFQVVGGKKTKVFTFFKDEIQISDIQMNCKMKRKPKPENK